MALSDRAGVEGEQCGFLRLSGARRSPSQDILWKSRFGLRGPASGTIPPPDDCMTSLDVGRPGGPSPPLSLLRDMRLLPDQAGGGTLRGLLDSERRRRALELTLAKTHRALQNQDLRLLLNKAPQPCQGDWTPQDRMLALKMKAIKGPESSGCNACQCRDLHKRIGRLRSELDLLSLKVDQAVHPARGCWHWGVRLPGRDRPLPVGHPGPDVPTAQLIALAMDNSQLQRERGDLECLVQDAWARLGVLEQDREALGSQVSGLHSELFQTRSQEQELQRKGLTTQAELTGSRQLNDSMLQEMAVLRQRLASSEARVALMESERSVAAARLVALETEREQLLSQKAMLVQRRWRSGAHSGSEPGVAHRPSRGPSWAVETDAGGGGTEKEEVEEVVVAEEGEEKEGQAEMKDQEVHLRHGSCEDLPESTSPVPAQPLHSTQEEAGDQTGAMLLCNSLRTGLEDTEALRVKLQASPRVHERRPIEYADWEKMGRIPQDQKDFLSQMEHVLTGEVARPAEHHSGTPRTHHDILEGRSSWLSQGGEETASRVLDPWQDDPLSANQITALVIELQQLRRVSGAPREVPGSPGDSQARARDWLERSRLLKECVKQMEGNEGRLEALGRRRSGEVRRGATTVREDGLSPEG
ncbi:hypothetical protein AAFF_G00435200 [Aldrovandia affinis]|uniref:Uncharacterized protein n=1 Tax=Aldrovandia affinis TaxID=143900 RepID=A0AAD7S888_9TELE|nr:hypothetical protein AAFF_G00435200 [Aldrovandia affinis]